MATNSRICFSSQTQTLSCKNVAILTLCSSHRKLFVGSKMSLLSGGGSTLNTAQATLTSYIYPPSSPPKVFLHTVSKALFKVPVNGLSVDPLPGNTGLFLFETLPRLPETQPPLSTGCLLFHGFQIKQTF